jgi:hypothetical protein
LLLVIGAIFGVGLSYSKVYLVHLILPLAFLIFFKVISIKKAFTPDHFKKVWIFLLWIGYFALSLLWAPHLNNGLKYLAQIVMGGSVSLLCYYLPDSKHNRKVILWLLSASLVIGLVESFFNVHWPISKYSSLAAFFGKYVNGNDISQTLPAAFYWTANNLCFVLLLSFPYMIKIQRFFFGYVYTFLSLILFARASSRAIFALGLAFVIFWFGRELLKKINAKLIISLICSAVVLVTSLFVLMGEENKKELMSYSRLIDQQLYGAKVILGLEEYDHDKRRDRTAMMVGAANLWKSSPWFGAGSGALLDQEIMSRGRMISLATPHFYWFELLAHGGVFFMLAFFIWWLQLFAKSLHSIEKSSSLVLFLLAAPACSTLVYFFPAWLYLGRMAKLDDFNFVDKK